MLVPRKTMEDELKAQEKELADDISNLNKKVILISLIMEIPAHSFSVKILGKAV